MHRQSIRNYHRPPRPITPFAMLLLVLAMIGALALLVAPDRAHAQTAYDLQASFDAPATGGEPTGYRLYRQCDNPGDRQLVGEVTSGQTLAAAVTAGVHHFCVAAYNGAGEGPIGEVARVEVGAAAPGAVRNLQILVPCDGACTVTVTVHPVD